MVLTMTRPPMYFYMFCALRSKSSLVASRLNYSMYLSISNETWFLCLTLVMELIDMILCVLTMTSKLLYNRAYEARKLLTNEESFL